MDDIFFETSIKQFCIQNKMKSTTYISSAKKIVRVLYLELNLPQTAESNISDLVNFAKKKPQAVEVAFYNVFKRFRKNNNASTSHLASVLRKILQIAGMDKTRLKIPPKNKKNKRLSQPRFFYPKRLKTLPEGSSVLLFVDDRLAKCLRYFPIKSILTKTVMLRYWVKFLSQFKSNLRELDMSIYKFSLKTIIKRMKSIVKTNDDVCNLHHLFYKINDEWDITVKQLKTHFNVKKTT